jgi:hypothetical protein
MTVTDEMISAANEAFADVQDMGELEHEDMRKVIEAAMQAAPEFEQEPIGEIECQHTDHGCESYASLWEDLPVKTLLYTHPQPKCEPLSEGQIDKLWLNFCSDLSIDTYTEFVRLIEKAHGIE